MDKITNIERFMKVYKAQANDRLKESYFDNNVKLTRTYIPVIEKINFVKSIVESTMMDKKTGKFYDSPNVRYIFYMLKLISLYTNIDLDITGENVGSYFDLFDENKMIEKIYQLIPESERNELTSFLNAETMAFEKNHNNVNNCITDILSSITPIINSFSSAIEFLSKEDENENNE